MSVIYYCFAHLQFSSKTNDDAKIPPSPLPPLPVVQRAEFCVLVVVCQLVARYHFLSLAAKTTLALLGRTDWLWRIVCGPASSHSKRAPVDISNNR